MIVLPLCWSHSNSFDQEKPQWIHSHKVRLYTAVAGCSIQINLKPLMNDVHPFYSSESQLVVQAIYWEIKTSVQQLSKNPADKLSRTFSVLRLFLNCQFLFHHFYILFFLDLKTGWKPAPNKAFKRYNISNMSTAGRQLATHP